MYVLHKNVNIKFIQMMVFLSRYKAVRWSHHPYNKCAVI